MPDIAPEYTVFGGGFRDSPEWGSAYVQVPALVYALYGDPRLLEEHYEGMKRYVAYLGGTAKEHIVSHGLGDWFDIGPGGPGESKLTSRGLTATAIYYSDIRIVEEAARRLGKRRDAEKYAALAEEVRRAFNRKFLDAGKNQYDRASQTANAMPFVVGLVPPERRKGVLQNLVRDVRGRGNRVTAGDVGFHYVVLALSAGGQGDVMYDMVTQDAGPGYVYQLKHHATSLTEAWDTNPASSQNHCMLGHAEEWFFIGLGGIRPAAPGFKRIEISPQIVGGLAWVKAEYRSPYGLIASEWKYEGQRLTLDVTIPANTTATVRVPARDAGSVTESGKPATKAEGVKFLRRKTARQYMRWDREDTDSNPRFRKTSIEENTDVAEQRIKAAWPSGEGLAARVPGCHHSGRRWRRRSRPLPRRRRRPPAGPSSPMWDRIARRKARKEARATGEASTCSKWTRPTGPWSSREVFANDANPSWLALNPARTHLYAANETATYQGANSGSVSAYAIDRRNGHLTLVNTVSSEGAGPAHLSVHPAGKHVLVANYAGGTVAVLPLGANGELGPATDVKTGRGAVGPTRAASAPPGSFAISGHERPHAHMIESDPAGRFVLASDLGRDRIFIWKFDAQRGGWWKTTRRLSPCRPAMGRGISLSIPAAAGSIRCRRKPRRSPSSPTTPSAGG